MQREQAVEWLHATEQIKRRTRATSRRYWFALVVFGLITAGATPLYIEPAASGLATESYVGAFVVSHPERLSLYWLLASAVGYLATVFYYRRRDRTSGIVSSARPFVVTGVALFLLLILVSPGGLALVGLLVLSAFERSLAFAAYALAFLGLAITVNLYDIGNLTWRLGLGQHGLQANVLTAGVMLLAGGAGFWLAGRRAA